MIYIKFRIVNKTSPRRMIIKKNSEISQLINKSFRKKLKLPLVKGNSRSKFAEMLSHIEDPSKENKVNKIRCIIERKGKTKLRKDYMTLFTHSNKYYANNYCPFEAKTVHKKPSQMILSELKKKPLSKNNFLINKLQLMKALNKTYYKY